MFNTTVMELRCSVQNYDWGKFGQSSYVAKLLKNADVKFDVDEHKPYAELWMGTHVNAPSFIKSTGQSLLKYLMENPSYLGQQVTEKFGKQLPFLFKVLSINKALSIQVHPNQKTAEELHKKHPDLYKDPNHKPELAIALTPFHALCGFRPHDEIKQFLRAVPELTELIGNDVVHKFLESDMEDGKKCLENTFRSLMTCEQENITTCLTTLLKKLSAFSTDERATYEADLIEKLHEQFPNDVGCLSIYFLNVVSLKPGEAIFLDANVPHAYISGDCIECMACSDNVVRAGLTPKFKDVQTLCSIINYEGQPARDMLFLSIHEDDYTDVFRPPVPDFAVARIKIPAMEKGAVLKVRSSASILLIISGSAKISDIYLKSGSVIFIAANQEIKIIDITEDIVAFQAMANI